MALKLDVCSDKGLWNSCISNSADCTIFHTWDFLKAIEEQTHSKLYPILLSSGSNYVGVYPLFFQKKSFFKLVFSPPPHVAVPYMGPMFFGFEKLKQSKRESIQMSVQDIVDGFIEDTLDSDYTFISTHPNLIDSRPFKWKGYSVRPMYNYIIDLTKGTDYLWKNLKSKLRQDINRENKRGVVVKEGSKKDLLKIFDSLNRRYGDQSRIVTVKKDYLIKLYDLFHPHNMSIVIAQKEGQFVGGLVDLYFNGKVSSWIGHAKPVITHSKVNDLLQWEAIRRAGDKGFKVYEEVGANTERLCKYKSKYNPSLSIYYSVKKYNSVLSYGLETGYQKILKPALGKFK